MPFPPYPTSRTSPKPRLAESVLTKLANDESDLPCEMNSRRSSVEMLTELTSHEDRVVGLERRPGPSYQTPIRTDLCDGFRSCRDIRRVLCYELPHNIWRDHDDNMFIGSRTARIYHS
jgi:hypothetical protein